MLYSHDYPLDPFSIFVWIPNLVGKSHSCGFYRGVEKSNHLRGFLFLVNFLSFTFSLWISFLIWEIFIFIASISSSWTRGMGLDSESSMVWKVKSASGMYHLQS